MSEIQALLENENVQTFITENEEILTETEQAVQDFGKVLKSFVLSHPEEFVAENTEETFKNIRVFSEVATAQFLQEVTTLVGSGMAEDVDEDQTYGNMNDYL